MNRLSWDTTAPRRTSGARGTNDPRPDRRGLDAEADLLRPAWDELRRIHRF
jgi:hypothetical protein